MTIDYSFSVDTVDPAMTELLAPGETGSGELSFDLDDLTLCELCTTGFPVYHVEDPYTYSWTQGLGPWSFVENPIALTQSVYDGFDFGELYGGVSDGMGLLMTVSELGGVTSAGPTIPGVGANEVATLGIFLTTAELTVVTVDDPFVPTSFDAFETRTAALYAVDAFTGEYGAYLAQGTLTSYSAVPEPGAGVLGSVVLTTLLAVRLKRRT